MTAAIKETLAEGEKITTKAVMSTLAAQWKKCSADEKKRYIDESDAWIAVHGKVTTSRLPKGWTSETVAGRTIYTHTESGISTTKRPVDHDRLVDRMNGVKKPLAPGCYAAFVKDNFKKYGSMEACAVAWKKMKA